MRFQALEGRLEAVWSDGWIIFSILAFYNNEILPNNKRFRQSRSKILSKS